MTRRHAILLLGVMAAPRARATATVATPLSFERALMGTRFSITCYHGDFHEAKTAAEAAFDHAERINQVASDYIADSELLGLSKHPDGVPVTVSPLLFQLILEARDLAEKTGGRFDPTLGPLTRLWRESRRRKSLPAPEILAAAQAATGWQSLFLDPHDRTITLTKPTMRLDLGGIAKGQAADAMLTAMKDYGIPRSCITAGGDIRVGEPPPAAQGWKVGIKTLAENDDSRFLFIANCGVSTSGDLHQFIEIAGTRYSHIIDPATGLGLTRSVTATVIAPTATVSDAVATACCVAPSDLARAIASAAGATKVYLADLSK